MIRITPVVGMAVIVTFAMAVPAEAQLIPGRPFRALFRTVSDPALSRNRVDFTCFLAGGHEDGDLRDARGELPLSPTLSSLSFGSLFAAAQYAHKGRRSQFSVNGAGTANYYSPLQRLSPMGVIGAVNWTGAVGRRTNATLSQSVSYSPYFVFSPSTPEDTRNDNPDAGSATQPMSQFDNATDRRTMSRTTYGYDTQAGLNSRTSRNSHLELVYAFRYMNTTGDAFDFASHRPSIRYAHSIGRYAALNLGYTFNVAEYINSPYARLVNHDIDAGLSYARPLPFSRQTRISVRTGTSVIAGTDSNRVYLRVLGSLSHQFSSNWTTGLTYRRSADVLEGFAAPFFTFTDRLTGGVGGRLVGPLRVIGSGSYTHGSFSVRSLDNTFRSKNATVRLWVPVTSMLAGYVETYYSTYEFQRRIGLLPTMPVLSTRYGVRGGLTLWLPIVR